jgi:hypothetical protein
MAGARGATGVLVNLSATGSTRRTSQTIMATMEAADGPIQVAELPEHLAQQARQQAARRGSLVDDSRPPPPPPGNDRPLGAAGSRMDKGQLDKFQATRRAAQMAAQAQAQSQSGGGARKKARASQAGDDLQQQPEQAQEPEVDLTQSGAIFGDEEEVAAAEALARWAVGGGRRAARARARRRRRVRACSAAGWTRLQGRCWEGRAARRLSAPWSCQGLAWCP